METLKEGQKFSERRWRQQFKMQMHEVLQLVQKSLQEKQTH